MKKVLLTGICISLSVYLLAQDVTNIHLQSLINAERAFAKMALVKNVPEAFLANVNDESINIEPNGITKMKKVWSERKPDASLLAWQPIFADISSSNDFGYTTGPWDYRPTRGEEPIGFGDYITIWKKQPEGDWKIIVDVGVQHPKPGNTQAFTTSSVSLKKSFGNADFKSELTATEKDFINALTNNANAYPANQSKEMRLYRQGMEPIVNADAIQKQLKADDAEKVVYNPLETQVASSGDLGFVTGTVSKQVMQSGNLETKNGKYLRIWKKEDGKTWKIVLDLLAI
jgi:ketosteroid isomerase-like protein